VTAGLSTTNAANKFLDLLRGTAWTAPTGLYVKLHTGDPGASAASNASGVTTRNQLTLAAASSGSCALSSLSSYSMTGTETISHVSVWDAASSGNFLFSAALSASKSVTNGDTLSFTTFSISVSPLAA
jgi:hypothetical protein